MSRAIRIPFGLIILFACTIEVAMARPSILSAWQAAYPLSDSDLANCQLCHQNSSGGNGWNAYGWNIRQQIQDNGLSNGAAIVAVELLNSDASFPVSSNVDEVNGSTQPGWTLGDVNTIYFKDGSVLVNQAAPSLPTPLDLPDEANVPIHTVWLAVLGLLMVVAVVQRRGV